MSVNENLRGALASLNPEDGPVFAVLDGAHYENLPQQLLLGGFVSRALYLDRGDNDPQRVMTAPHMVWIDERGAAAMGRAPARVIPEVLTLVGSSAGAVFWQCPAGGEALYKHLRGINMVMIPRAAAGDDEEDPESVDLTDADAVMPATPEIETSDSADSDEDGSGDETHTMVLFRHADANVIAQLLPRMAPDEAARFLGPASLVFAAPDPEWREGAPLTHRAAHPGAIPYRGPLRLSEETLGGIEETQLKASRGVIARYLQKVAPEYTDRLNQDQLHGLVVNAEQVGDRLGFTTEYAQGLWALLALVTGGEILTNQQVIGHFESDPRAPDEVLDELYDQMTDASDYDLEALT